MYSVESSRQFTIPSGAWAHLLTFAKRRNNPSQKSSLNGDQCWLDCGVSWVVRSPPLTRTPTKITPPIYVTIIQEADSWGKCICYENSESCILINEWALIRISYSTGCESGAMMWKIQPPEVRCVLSRTRGSVKTTVHRVPAKNQVFALLKDSVVLLDEKWLLRGLKILMPQRVLTATQHQS